MTQIKLVAIAGSSRDSSYNKQLTKIAANIAQELNVKTTYVNLQKYYLPIYNGDLEGSNFPKNALKLQKLFKQHHKSIISSPEHNSTISALLKNTIDWTTRDGSGGADLSAYKRKTVLLISISPGALDGLMGLMCLRIILSNIGMVVHPDQLIVPKAMSNLSKSGALTNPNIHNRLFDLIHDYIILTTKLNITKE
jgi:chromate reductase, NAD(P)H dehydrogenase (quinone)